MMRPRNMGAISWKLVQPKQRLSTLTLPSPATACFRSVFLERGAQRVLSLAPHTMSSAGERFRARMAAAAATTAATTAQPSSKGQQQAAVHLRVRAVHSTSASSFSLSASPATPAAAAAASLASPPPPPPSVLGHAAHPAGCCCWSCYTAASTTAAASSAATADDYETRAKLDLLTDIITIQRWARQMQFVRRMPRRYPATDRVVRDSCRKTDATLSHSRLWRERMAAMVAEVDERIRGNGDGSGGGGGGGGGSDTRRGEGEGKSGGPARRGGGGDTQAKDDAYESMRLENEFLRLQIGALVLMCSVLV